MVQSVLAKIDTFFSRYPAQAAPSGTVLISADEDPDAVYKLDSGRVVEYDISKDGTRIFLNVFQPPAFLPMSWVVNRSSNSYYYETHGDCVYRKAPAADVLEFVRREPDVLLDLIGRLYSGISGLQRRLVYMATDTAQKRLAYEFLITAYRFGERQSDGSFAIPFSESDLASNSGLSRETVNREISKLKRRGLVTVNNKKLYLTSLVKLEHYLDE